MREYRLETHLRNDGRRHLVAWLVAFQQGVKSRAAQLESRRELPIRREGKKVEKRDHDQQSMSPRRWFDVEDWPSASRRDGSKKDGGGRAGPR